MPNLVDRILVGALVGAVFVACGRSRPPAPDPAAMPAPPSVPPAAVIPEAEQIRVTVVNNRADGGAVTVYVEPTAGTRTAMGTVESGTTRTFAYRVQGGGRSIKLIALNAAGAQMESEVITVPQGAQVNWDLQINSVRIRR